MNLIENTVSCLQQAKVYLKAIDPKDYQQAIPLLSNSTLGEHTRHFIEFYQCLLRQIGSGSINYDTRQRDKRIERNPSFALATIDEIIQQLGHLPLKKACTLYSEVELAHPFSTNVERELLYNLEHSIHHLAIIKIGLAILLPDLVLPKNFGVAASTVKYRQTHLAANLEGI